MKCIDINDWFWRQEGLIPEQKQVNHSYFDIYTYTQWIQTLLLTEPKRQNHVKEMLLTVAPLWLLFSRVVNKTQRSHLILRYIVDLLNKSLLLDVIVTVEHKHRPVSASGWSTIWKTCSDWLIHIYNQSVIIHWFILSLKIKWEIQITCSLFLKNKTENSML